MAGSPEKKIPLRVLKGVDLLANARIEDPGSLRRSENMYQRLRGTLEKRTGSTLVSQTLVARTVANITGGGTLSADVFEVLTNIPTYEARDLATAIFIPDSLKQGPPYVQPIIKGPGYVNEDDLVPSTFTSDNALAGSMRVAALAKVYPRSHGKGYWVGAMHHESRDFLFWINDSNQMQLLPTVLGQITCAFGNWQIIPMRVGNTDVDQNISDVNGGIAILTNGIDKPLLLKLPSAINTNQPFGVYSMNVAPSAGSAHVDTDDYIFACNAIARFGSQVCYAGFMLGKDAGASYANYKDSMCFGDPQEPWNLASDDSLFYTVRPSLDRGDEVTALSASGFITDGSGPRGQIVCFTQQHVFVYEGLPPVSGSPSGSDFGVSNVLGEVGCVSPKTVVRTPYGVCFLGTDGLVYLIALNNRIVPISRALEPALGGRPSRSYMQWCAWYEKGYYKLSYADSIYGPFNNRQYWGSLRTMDLSNPQDAGVMWFGPMTGQNVNCVGKARDLITDDIGQIYAGLSHRAGVVRISVPDTYTDVAMNDLTATKKIGFDIEFGDMDLGDAHQDKTLKAVSAGFAVNETTSIKCSMSASGEADFILTGQGVTGEEVTKTVAPNAHTLGVNFTLGTSRLTSEFNYSLPTFQPAAVVRGCAIGVRFAEQSPTVATPVTLSDVQIRVIPMERNST